MANSALVKTILYKSLAEGVYKDVVSRSSSYYYFLGKTLSWDDENFPPSPVDSYEYERDVRNEVITIKEIKPSDVAFVVPRRDWISDVVYDMFDDQYSDQLVGVNIVSGGIGYIDPSSVVITITGGGGTGATAVCQEVVDGQISKVTLTNRGTGYTSIPTISVESPSGNGAVLRAKVGITASGIQKLEDANFYVVTDEYNVYKCIDNNNNARSRNKPTGTQLEPITTLDGYVWKFMYNIPINLRNKFYTDEYIPVVSALTNQFYSNGTVDNIFIANKGKDYTAATISVSGDGYREADPIYINSAQVVQNGTGYTNPTVVFSPPQSSSSVFIPRNNVNLGQILFNPDSEDYYEVVTPGTLSTVAPTHKYGTVQNGTAAVKFVGSRLRGTVVTKNNKNITRIDITNPGSSYTEPPIVTITDSTGADASAVAVIGTSSISSILVTAQGNNYVSPTIEFISESGTGAVATPRVENGHIVGVDWVNHGSGYETEPQVVVSDSSGGSGAILRAILSGSPVQEINVINGGSNYTNPTVTLTGGGGVGAAGAAVVETGVVDQIILEASIREVVITNPGSGYIEAPEVVVGIPVETITINDGGRDYTTPPEIIITDGGGLGASAHSEINDGLITTIDITNNGSNYTVAPTVTISDPTGSGATAEALLSGTPISAVVVQNGGSGYVTTPTVTFSQPEAAGGVVAAGSAVLSGAGVTEIYVNNQGSGYTSFPTVTIDATIGDNGSGATAEPVMSGAAVTSTTVTNGGSGYSVALVTFSDPDNVNGIPAEGEAVISNGAITNIVVTTPGSGYVLAPTITIAGNGTGATATCTVATSRVVGIDITDPGSGYKIPPTVTITGGGGTGATAGAFIGTSSISSINISNAGSGYTSAPIATISEPTVIGGVTATATATIGKSTISSIVITNRGLGYTNPTVTISAVSGDTGSGCTATATYNDGVVTAIVVDAGGNGYYQSPDITILGDGVGAAATANLLSGRSAVIKAKLYADRVISTIVVDPGENYYKTPTISFGRQAEKGLEVFSNEQYINNGNLYTVVEHGVFGSKLPTHIAGVQYTSNAWQSNTEYEFGDTVYVADRLYDVIVAGTSGSTAPTHIDGVVTNGTVELEYLGRPASLRRDGEAAVGYSIMRYGAGYSITPTAVISDPTGSGAEINFFTSKSDAKIAPVLEDSQIVFLVVEDPGTGYTKATITVNGTGTGASLIPDLSLGNVSSQQANNEILTPTGTIDAIAVVSGGYSYGVANVIIEGDGTGATAEAEIDPVTNAINKVHITNRGKNYTYANVKVIGNETGNGAVLRAIISPYGGHGKNCPEELFSRTLMFYSNISTDLNQGVTVGNDYRQVGIIKNPRGYNEYQRFQGNIGSACYIVQSPIDTLRFVKDDDIYIERVTTPDIEWEPSLEMEQGQFIWYGEKIYTVIVSGKGGSIAPSTTTGTEANGAAVLTYVGSTHSQKRYRIVSVSATSALVQPLDNDEPKANDIFIKTSSINDKFTAVTVGLPDFDKYSGQLMYIDNKQGFTPSGDETITLRTIIKF